MVYKKDGCWKGSNHNEVRALGTGGREGDKKEKNKLFLSAFLCTIICDRFSRLPK